VEGISVGSRMTNGASSQNIRRSASLRGLLQEAVDPCPVFPFEEGGGKLIERFVSFICITSCGQAGRRGCPISCYICPKGGYPFLRCESR